MLVSLAWRNLVRNRRRSVFTGLAVSCAVILLGWLVGFTYGAYDKMVDSAVRTRLGHLQVMREGYLDQPEPRMVVPGADELVRKVSGLEGVVAVSPRVLAEGLLLRGQELAAVDLVGVDPGQESAASSVPHRVMTGEKAAAWCRAQMTLPPGDDRAAFDRWCEATGKGEFLPAGKPEAVVLGTGVARRLGVTVGDVVSVQVANSERRLQVSGIVAAGSPEIAERGAYVRAATLNELLGTQGPNELAIVLRSIDGLEQTRAQVQSIVGNASGLAVSTWAERSPMLNNMIEMMKASRIVFFCLLALLAVLGVANATLTSVLERKKQFGVMLALGTRPSTLVRLVMIEVALLGLLAVGAGVVVAAGIEVFGRIHGWPMALVGLEPRTLEELSLSGAAEDTTFFARTPLAGAALIAGGVYLMFLVTGLWAALKVGRLKVLTALHSR